MRIFVPKAQEERETRTPLTPDSARKLIALGATVCAEAEHGTASGYPDAAYEEVGVEIVRAEGAHRETIAAARNEADVVLGVEKPSVDEIGQMRPDSLFLGTVDPFNRRDLVEAFARAHVSAVSMEMIPRSTIAQKMDVLSSQANLAGYMAVIVAAERLNKILPMMMTPAGTISPARVFVIGVGVAGLQAIATAKRLGARVEAFDTRPVVEEQVKSLGAKFVKIDVGDTGQTEQGYARELTPEQLERQRQGMAKICADSDVVITTAKLFGRPAPTLLTREMVAGMKPGSVIVDLAAETGGNVEGTERDEEVVTEDGVRIVGISKLENLVPAHASQVYAANLLSFIEHFWDEETNTVQLDENDEIIQSALLTRNGQIVHERFRD